MYTYYIRSVVLLDIALVFEHSTNFLLYEEHGTILYVCVYAA